MHPAERYIKNVKSGKIIVCDYVKLAVKRHLSDLKNVKKTGFYFDKKEAQRWIDFAHACYHHQGEFAGKRIQLEDWQQFIFWCFYGWKRKDGTRRFRVSIIEVARKNGKTTMEAIPALAAITIDNESGAQVYCGATKQDQAMILVNDAGQIVKRTPGLRKRLKLFEHNGLIRRVVNMKKASFIAAIGRDSNTQDGFNPHVGVMDEMHAHKTSDILNVIESGMGARLQPMLKVITTAGYNKQGPYYAMRNNVIDILKGIKHDDSVFGIIYTLDEGDDWQDPKIWVKANPNLDVSVKLSFLKDRLQSAKNEGGTKEVDFKTKNLNMWVDSAETWIEDEIWVSRAQELPNLKGKDCYGGLDLAVTRDITALTLTFPINGVLYQKYYFWLPEDNISKRVKEGVPYDQWVKAGYIMTTPGNVTDYNFIQTTMQQIREEYNMISCAYDRYNATQLVLNMQDDGAKMTPFSQAITVISAPTKEFESKILSQKNEFVHDGNPVMRWMMRNVFIRRDSSGNIKIDKEKSIEKVDGPVSAVMSLGEYMTHESSPEPIIEVW